MLTKVDAPFAGRADAAYGGVYNVTDGMPETRATMTCPVCGHLK
jgi:hypothetical protein